MSGKFSNNDYEEGNGPADSHDGVSSSDLTPPSSTVFVPIGIQATIPIRDRSAKPMGGSDALDESAADLRTFDDDLFDGASEAPGSDVRASCVRTSDPGAAGIDGAGGNHMPDVQDDRKLDDSSDETEGDAGGELTVDLADVVDLANVMAVSSGAAPGKIPSDILAASTDADTNVDANSSTGSGIDVDGVKEASSSDVEDGAKPSDAPIDPVAARRIAHGLSPVSPFDKSASEPSESAKHRSNASGKASDKNASANNTSHKNAKDDANSKTENSAEPKEADQDISPQKRRAERFRDKRRVERDKKEKKAKRKRIVKIIIAVLIGLFVALVIAFFAVLAFIRSGMIDDTQEIKGVWRSTQSGVELSITDDNIVLTDDVAYKYTIDPNNKTISFTFGNLEGNVRYRLSLDGKELSLYDADIDSSDTFIEDIPWLTENLWAIIFNDDLPSAYLGKGSELLERVE